MLAASEIQAESIIDASTTRYDYTDYSGIPVAVSTYFFDEYRTFAKDQTCVRKRVFVQAERARYTADQGHSGGLS